MTRSKSRKTKFRTDLGSHLRNRNFPYVARIRFRRCTRPFLVAAPVDIFRVRCNDVRRLLAFILQPYETGSGRGARCGSVSFSFHQIVQPRSKHRCASDGETAVARIAQTFVRTRLAALHGRHSQFRFSLTFHLGLSSTSPSSSRARISRARH